MTETRKLAAILAADVVGYSRLAGADEDRTLARLRALRSDLIDPTVSVHHGRVVKRTGDGSLIEFRSVVDAVRCAIEVQNGMIERNAGLPPERRIEFRIGIHVGDVVEESDGDLMGDGINIASRLEGIADPNGICLSGAAYEQVRDKLRESFVDLGDKELKNIARPVRTYAIVTDGRGPKAHVASQTSIAPSVPRPQAPEKPPREFVDARVTREFLKGLFEENHFKRAEQLASRYIGKWMPVSGPLGQIFPGPPRSDGGRFPSMVTFSDVELPWFYMMFSDEWVDRVVLVPKGQNISLVGRVKEIERSVSGDGTVMLEDCELVDPDKESSTRSAPARRRTSPRSRRKNHS